MTTCSSLACNRTATHHSRRFGPETPYCREDAAWADGVMPGNQDRRVAPIPLDPSTTRVDQAVQAR